MKKLVLAFLLVKSFSQVYGDDCTIGFVNLKRCLDESEIGKKETAELEALKKQFSSNIEQMEEELSSLFKKLQDEDYMDSLSPSAKEELQKKAEELSQEYSVYQNQSYQVLNQQNYKRVQKLIQEVKNASEKVRKEKGLTFVLNEEAVLSASEDKDITNEVINVLNELSSKK